MAAEDRAVGREETWVSAEIARAVTFRGFRSSFTLDTVPRATTLPYTGPRVVPPVPVTDSTTGCTDPYPVIKTIPPEAPPLAEVEGPAVGPWDP